MRSDLGNLTRGSPLCVGSSNWIQIQLALEIGCAIDSCCTGDSTLTFSPGIHERSPKVQLGGVLVVCATAQVNVGLAVFSTSGPGNVMVEL